MVLDRVLQLRLQLQRFVENKPNGKITNMTFAGEPSTVGSPLRCFAPTPGKICLKSIFQIRYLSGQNLSLPPSQCGECW